MQVDMYYWKTSGSGGHVYDWNICYGRTCPVCGLVLQDCAEAANVVDVMSLGYWCGFCFPRIYCLKCS